MNVALHVIDVPKSGSKKPKKVDTGTGGQAAGLAVGPGARAVGRSDALIRPTLIRPALTRLGLLGAIAALAGGMRRFRRTRDRCPICSAADRGYGIAQRRLGDLSDRAADPGSRRRGDARRPPR